MRPIDKNQRYKYDLAKIAYMLMEKQANHRLFRELDDKDRIVSAFFEDETGRLWKA